MPRIKLGLAICKVSFLNPVIFLCLHVTFSYSWWSEIRGYHIIFLFQLSRFHNVIEVSIRKAGGTSSWSTWGHKFSWYQWFKCAIMWFPSDISLSSECSLLETWCLVYLVIPVLSSKDGVQSCVGAFTCLHTLMPQINSFMKHAPVIWKMALGSPYFLKVATTAT